MQVREARLEEAAGLLGIGDATLYQQHRQKAADAMLRLNPVRLGGGELTVFQRFMGFGEGDLAWTPVHVSVRPSELFLP